MTEWNPARKARSRKCSAWRRCGWGRVGGIGMSWRRAWLASIWPRTSEGKVECASWLVRLDTNPWARTKASRETANKPARRESALLTADAMPVWVDGTEDITALVSGATQRVIPQPR